MKFEAVILVTLSIWQVQAPESPLEHTLRTSSLQGDDRIGPEIASLFKSEAEMSKLNDDGPIFVADSIQTTLCTTHFVFEAYGRDESDCYPHDYSTKGFCCVLTMGNRYQLAHTGRCGRPGSTCGFGICAQTYRLVSFVCLSAHGVDIRLFNIKSHCGCFH